MTTQDRNDGWTRRPVLQGLAATAAGLARPGRAAAARRSDIVFILADDLGFADLGCYGRRDIRTPAIDGLAREGARLTQAYANSAVCSASRTAIITGRYQYRLRVGLDEPGGGPDVAIPEHFPTLPAQLRADGYRTALIGKWHLGGGKAGPLQAGYDYFYGFHGGATDYFNRPTEAEAKANAEATPAKPGGRPGDALWENEQVIQPPGYLTDLLADAAIRQVREAGGRPLFLSLHFNAPHWPWEGPDDEAVSKSLKGLRHEDGGSEAVYARMIERMDEAVGRVLAALRQAGRADDAIIVFTSDNGGERFADTWPLIGTKGELLEGGIRVPAIVRWPGRIPAGRALDQVAIGMDWLPTLLAAAGATPDAAAPSDGENLLPVLRGSAPPHPRTLFWRYKASDQAAVRDGDWKFLALGGREHLFNIARDERERADFKTAEPKILKALKAKYDAWNAVMLPYPVDSFSETPKGHYADRY